MDDSRFGTYQVPYNSGYNFDQNNRVGDCGCGCKDDGFTLSKFDIKKQRQGERKRQRKVRSQAIDEYLQMLTNAIEDVNVTTNDMVGLHFLGSDGHHAQMHAV